MGIQLKFGSRAMVIEDLRTLGSHTPTASVTTTQGTFLIVPSHNIRDGYYLTIRYCDLPEGIQDKVSRIWQRELQYLASRARNRHGTPCYNAHRGRTNEDEARGLDEKSKENPADDTLYRVRTKQYGSNGRILELETTLTIVIGKDILSRSIELGKIKAFALL